MPLRADNRATPGRCSPEGDLFSIDAAVEYAQFDVLRLLKTGREVDALAIMGSAERPKVSPASNKARWSVLPFKGKSRPAAAGQRDRPVATVLDLLRVDHAESLPTLLPP